MLNYLLLLLTNTDRHQQFEDYVKVCTRQLTKFKTIYRFHKLVSDRGDSSLECLSDS